jgi:hypothetical protein
MNERNSQSRQCDKGNQFINPIEDSLLEDLVGLYRCDLMREKHSLLHVRCLACSKQAIISAVLRYRALNSLYLSRASIHHLSSSADSCLAKEC